MAPAPSVSMVTPILRRQATVEATSAPGARCVTDVVPRAIEPMSA
jgi:hypothetical protein